MGKRSEGNPHAAFDEGEGGENFSPLCYSTGKDFCVLVTLWSILVSLLTCQLQLVALYIYHDRI